ncbi:MAG: PstS family phosphate ABC transporter substrate-binding protein [Methylohalobius sp.]
MALGLLIWQVTSADTLRIYSDRPLAPTTSFWFANFRTAHPDATVFSAAANTLTAVQALLNREAELIAIGRALTPAEALAFQQHHGRLPLAVPVGLDALGVVVHPSDPRQELGLAELEYLYAGTHRCHRGPPTSLLSPKALYAPSPANASHSHFQTKVLCGSPMRNVVLLADDAAVVEQIAHQPGALGFASRALATQEVRLLPLVLPPGRSKVLPSADRLASGHYPLTYYLYLYLDQSNPLAVAFARTALLPESQAILARRFVPLPESIRQQALKRLEQLRD